MYYALGRAFCRISITSWALQHRSTAEYCVVSCRTQSIAWIAQCNCARSVLVVSHSYLFFVCWDLLVPCPSKYAIHLGPQVWFKTGSRSHCVARRSTYLCDSLDTTVLTKDYQWTYRDMA